MKYPHEVKLLVKAFDVIGRVDPKLLDSMRSSRWEVRAAYTVDDVIGPDTGFMEEMELTMMFGGVFGVTGKKHSGSSFPGITYLNLPYIRKIAAEKNMPLAEFTADVLAHEFKHYEDGGAGGEPPAFAEGTRFACQDGIANTVCQFARANQVAQQHREAEGNYAY